MKIFRIIYTAWGCFVFVILMILLLPFFHLFSLKEEWHTHAAYLNNIWAKGFFFFSLMPYKVEYRYKPEAGQPYVYCANHTSWLDIIVLGLIVRGDHMFMGKESLSKAPLFGPMFSKLHILVNRESHTSSFRALVHSMQAIDKGRSVVIFPEGGITTNNSPQMAEFKDGPFRVAIERQVPVLLVVMPHNWFILPNDGSFLANWRMGKAIVLPPITTEGMTIADVENLKQEAFDLMQEELYKYYPQIQAI